MKGAKIVLLALFMLMCGEKTGKTVSSPNEMRMGESRTAQLPPANNGPPVQWFPQRDHFVTGENDAFLVLVGLNCGSGSPNEARFELLPPTPSFVRLLPVCSPAGITFAQTLVAIGPLAGDAGKYEVRVGATACGDQGGTAGQILRFTLKVKRKS